MNALARGCRLHAAASAGGASRRQCRSQRVALRAPAAWAAWPSPRQRRCACEAATAAGTPVEPPPGLRPEPWLGTPEQQQALEQLRARMQAGGVGCPGDDVLRWYLRDRYFNVAEAEGKLTSMLTWRRNERIDQFDPSSEAALRETATGKAYVHSAPDRYGRPVVVIRVRKHVIGEFPIADSKRLAGHILDTALAALPPGGEQLLGVFDLRGFDLRNADIQFAAFLVDAFFEYYPRRVAQVLMVDAPWVFRPSWELIKPLLRKYSALVRFVDRPALSEYFEPGALPDDFRA